MLSPYLAISPNFFRTSIETRRVVCSCSVKSEHMYTEYVLRIYALWGNRLPRYTPYTFISKYVYVVC